MKIHAPDIRRHHIGDNRHHEAPMEQSQGQVPDKKPVLCRCGHGCTLHYRLPSVSRINKLYDDWYVAVETSDIQGYVDSLDDNIVLIPPGGPVITGRENYRTFLGPVFDVATYEIDQKTPKNIKFYGNCEYSVYLKKIIN